MSELKTAHEALAGWSAKMPEREFLLQPVDGRLRVTTFSEALDQARRMAAALLGMGMEPGERVVGAARLAEK